MLMEQTIEKMHLMKLKKMADSFTERVSRADHQDLSHGDFVGFLVEDEYQAREGKRFQSRYKQAKFKDGQTSVEGIDHHFKRELPKQVVLELSQLQWLKNFQNLMICGATGLGKSYISQALGHQAIRQGYGVKYYRCSNFYRELQMAKADGSFNKHLKFLSRLDLIILDDFGLSAMTEEIKQDLFEVIEDRHKAKSTIIASQLPFEKWHVYLGGGMVADSVCDRLKHTSQKIDLKGKDTYRKELTESK